MKLKDYEYWLVKDEEGTIDIAMTFVYGDYVQLKFCGDEHGYDAGHFEFIRKIDLN